jgi:tRNA pseudouridine55 synthase
VDGFLNLNKPSGFTSHDCVAKVRHILKMKRVGHAGTLDPAATGVLPIALGKATRLLQFLREDKAYRATIRLGLQTTTDDLEGETLAIQSVSSLDLAQVKTALHQFQGKIQQIPPNYSAIQVQGKRLYDLAREGKEIAVKAREVEVFRIDVLDWRAGEFPEVDLMIACGPGTYIRAIARDLGTVMGVGGTLAQLTRTHSSGFALADSITLADLTQMLPDQIQPMAPDQVLDHLPAIVLPADIARRWCQGQKIPWETLSLPLLNAAIPLDTEILNTEIPRATFRIQDQDSRFLGIGLAGVDANLQTILVPEMVFEPI